MYRQIILIAVLLSLIGKPMADVNPDFTPKWQTGDTWTVLVRALYLYEPASPIGLANRGPEAGPAMKLQFSILEEEMVDGHECHTVDIRVEDPQTRHDSTNRWVMHVDKNTFTLRDLIHIKEEDGAVVSQFRHRNKVPDDFVLFVHELGFYMPFDFPNMPATVTSNERTISVPSSQHTITQTVTILDPSTIRIQIEATVYQDQYRTVQIWEKGEPWWSSLERTLTRKDAFSDKMITEVEAKATLEGTDHQPPRYSLRADPEVLWPVNGKLVPVTVKAEVRDDGDILPTTSVDSVCWGGSVCMGIVDLVHKSGDCYVDSRGNLFLRAQKNDDGTERVYTLHYTASDVSGNKASATACVGVPHEENAVPSEKVSPVLEHVEDNCDGTFTAHFGYYSRNSEIVKIPISKENKFSGLASVDQGQPEYFLPGRMRDVFSVVWDGSTNLAWRLESAGRAATSTASSGAAENTCR